MKKQQITIFGGIIIFSILLILFVSQNEFSRLSSENNVSKKMITDFETNHGFIKESLAGNIEDDPSDYVTGKQSLKITTDGNEKHVTITNNAIEPKIGFNEKFLKMWIKVNDTSKINNLIISISGDNFLTQKNYWVANNDTRATVKNLRNNQWDIVTVSLTQSDNPLVDISKIDSVSIILQDNGSGAVSVWIDSLSLEENSNNAVLTFTFDDAVENQYTNARTILAKYDFPATAYVPINWIDKPTRLSIKQLKVLEDDYGWDISPHTRNHIDLSNALNEHRFEFELEGAKRFLHENGLDKGVDHFAYPYGKFDNNLAMSDVKNLYKTARGTWGDIETLPAGDLHRLRVMYIFNHTQPVEVLERIDQAKENGDWLILVFHSIVDSDSNQPLATYLKSDFEQIVDDVYNKEIQVMTVSEVYNKIIEPNLK